MSRLRDIIVAPRDLPLTDEELLGVLNMLGADDKAREQIRELVDDVIWQHAKHVARAKLGNRAGLSKQRIKKLAHTSSAFMKELRSVDRNSEFELAIAYRDQTIRRTFDHRDKQKNRDSVSQLAVDMRAALRLAKVIDVAAKKRTAPLKKGRPAEADRQEAVNAMVDIFNHFGARKAGRNLNLNDPQGPAHDFVTFCLSKAGDGATNAAVDRALKRALHMVKTRRKSPT